MSIFDFEEDTKEDTKPNIEKKNKDNENNSTEQEVVPFQVGDFVRIQINVTPEEDPETYYYLEKYKNKRGIIKEVIPEPRLQYKVSFGDEFRYVYHEEIKYVL